VCPQNRRPQAPPREDRRERLPVAGKLGDIGRSDLLQRLWRWTIHLVVHDEKAVLDYGEAIDLAFEIIVANSRHDRHLGKASGLEQRREAIIPRNRKRLGADLGAKLGRKIGAARGNEGFSRALMLAGRNLRQM